MTFTQIKETRKRNPLNSQIITNKVLLEFQEFDEEKPKYLQYHKITALLKYEQKALLDFIAKRILTERICNKNSQRITANSLLRVMVEILNERQNEIDFSDIHTEDELKKSLKNLL